MDLIKKQAQKAGADPSKRTPPLYYPGPKHLRENTIDSPTRVFSDVMYILNEQVINHLTDTMPGPATFIFMVSFASFGSNFLPIGGAGAAHGVIQAINQLPILISKGFTGYSGSMASAQGVVAAVLEFKLASVAALGALTGMEKNNTFIETLANDPEKILAGFVAFVGLGMTIGYLPPIPALPGILGEGNIYGTFIDLLIEESKQLQNGIAPLTGIEYGFLAFKSLKIIEDLTKQGKAPFDLSRSEAFVKAFTDEKVLDETDQVKREEKTKAILTKFGVTDSKTIALYVQHVNLTYNEKGAIKARGDQAREQAKINHDEMVKAVAAAKPTPENASSFDKLQKAIQMLGDEDCPLTFSPDQRDDAILFYNHLSNLFDDYNKDIVENPDKYGNHVVIPKEDYLLAFRNKFCPTGRNVGAGLIRQLSAYPFYPLRYLAREAQLLIYKNSPFVKDTIAARRAEDIALWRQWGAMLLQSAYAAGHLLNKVVKFFAWVPLTIYNRIKYAPTTFAISMEHAGRWTNEHIRLDEKEPPIKYLQGRTSNAAHTASDYKDVREASKVIMRQLEANQPSRHTQAVILQPVMGGGHPRLDGYRQDHALKRTESPIGHLELLRTLDNFQCKKTNKESPGATDDGQSSPSDTSHL